MKKLFLVSWPALSVLLVLYSFTQTDLSLTLSRVAFIQDIEKSFQRIGYFNRALSTNIFLLIFILFSGLYLWSLYLVYKKKVGRKLVWTAILVAGVLITFSYNAFSYDLFNYIFDAKIVTYYHQNPYQHRALDYPGDPMLSFMHWTHRTFPYGPMWLILTAPLSWFGLGYFLPTLYIFKFFVFGCFIASAYLIEKIAKKTRMISPLFALTFFALNPLVLVESLVSAHNDIVMMFLSLVALYFLFNKRTFVAILFLVASIGIKFASIFLVPSFVYLLFLKKVQKEDFKTFFYSALIAMVPPVVFASYRTTFQPWYLLFILPYASFLADRKYIYIPAVTISLLALLQYVPYLYSGNWDPPIPTILNNLLWFSIGFSGVILLVSMLLQKSFRKR